RDWRRAKRPSASQRGLPEMLLWRSCRRSQFGRRHNAFGVEKRIEPTGAIERIEFVGAPDVSLADENLRHRVAPAGALVHAATRLIIAAHVDLGKRHALTLEKRLSGAAVAAKSRRVDLDPRHGWAVFFAVQSIWEGEPVPQPAQIPAHACAQERPRAGI